MIFFCGGERAIRTIDVDEIWSQVLGATSQDVNELS